MTWKFLKKVEIIKIHKIVMICTLIMINNQQVNLATNIIKLFYKTTESVDIEPIYSNIWGTIYNPVVEQCDNTPNITGDGSYINIDNASNLRWVAISQDLLNCEYRQSLMSDTNTILYKGKIEYGDSIWIVSPNKEINGLWVVHDAKNKRYRNSIDFLQTTGDGDLYNNNPLWSGKFDSIVIYKYNEIKNLNKMPC